MTEIIGKAGIQIKRKKDGKASIRVPHLKSMTVLEAEAFMCEFIDAIIRAREIDGDPLPS
jgi:hypothetical protein